MEAHIPVLHVTAAAIVAFWRDAGPKCWFAHDPAFDRTIAERFEAAHQAAARGTLAAWEETPEGALALVLLTDQFSRNLYRGSAHAFATDEMARNAARRALARGFDQAFDPALRQFFYLPFEHHEDGASQARAVALYQALTEAGGAPAQGLEYARLHAGLIARFGRFPHRNRELGRTDTEEEIEFLRNGGFAG
jgi:uncharacterized protein (DUF924 family)